VGVIELSSNWRAQNSDNIDATTLDELLTPAAEVLQRIAVAGS
jgi:hypothetical protein